MASNDIWNLLVNFFDYLRNKQGWCYCLQIVIPFITSKAEERVQEKIEEAIANGATCAAGGLPIMWTGGSV